MLCSVCGKQISENETVCPYCGNAIGVTSQGATQKVKKKLSAKAIALVCLVVCAIVATAVVLSVVLPKRVDLDVDYSNDSIREFMTAVCENVDAEAAYVATVEHREKLLEKFIVANITVKLEGVVEKNVEVRFYNEDDSDKVAKIMIYYSSADSENEKTCKDAVANALELGLSGDCHADEYTAEFKTVGSEMSIYDEAKTIAVYALGDEAEAKITCYGLIHDSWTGNYSIEKKAEG